MAWVPQEQGLLDVLRVLRESSSNENPDVQKEMTLVRALPGVTFIGHDPNTLPPSVFNLSTRYLIILPISSI
jgi:hypothetical protein